MAAVVVVVVILVMMVLPAVRYLVKGIKRPDLFNCPFLACEMPTLLVCDCRVFWFNLYFLSFHVELFFLLPCSGLSAALSRVLKHESVLFTN